MAGHVLKATDDFADGLSLARESFEVPVKAFGNTAEGLRVHGAQRDAAASGGTAAERLARVLENDVDRIYRVAFAYREADLVAADKVDRQAPVGGPQP